MYIHIVTYTNISLLFAIGHAKKRKMTNVSDINIDSEEDNNHRLEDKQEGEQLELEDS